MFVLLFVLAIQLFRTHGAIPKLIPRNSRTILSIAGTWSAFLVILLVRRLFAANSLQPCMHGILCPWLLAPSLGHPFFIRTSPIARCGYIARSMLSLPAVYR